jgi:hypothetical protein
MAEALDLAPDFEHVTISSQLSVVENAINLQPRGKLGSFGKNTFSANRVVLEVRGGTGLA